MLARSVGAIAIALAACKGSDANNACDALFATFRDAAGATADGQKSWFMARCAASDSAVGGCVEEVLAAFSGPTEMQKTALAFELPACVQKHRTRTAGPSAGDRVAAAKLRPGLVPLPDDLQTLSLDGTAWVGTRPDGRTWIFLPTWRGRCRNVAGFLWSSAPFQGGDFGRDNTIAIDGFVVADPCSTGTPQPWTAEAEPFSVIERPGDRWVFIHWGWD